MSPICASANCSALNIISCLPLTAYFCTRCVWLLPRSPVKHSSPPLGLGWLLHTLSPRSGQTLQLQRLRRVDSKMKGSLVVLLTACLATAQHQALIDYLERRLLAIEVRLHSCSLPSPALQNPSQRKLPGTGHRQWNADVTA